VTVHQNFGFISRNHLTPVEVVSLTSPPPPAIHREVYMTLRNEQECHVEREEFELIGEAGPSTEFDQSVMILVSRALLGQE
jgi:hypothetical protein